MIKLAVIVMSISLLLSGCAAIMCNDTNEAWPGVPKCSHTDDGTWTLASF